MKLQPKIQRILLLFGPAVLIATASALTSFLPKTSVCKVEQERLSELLKDKQPTDVASQARRLDELKEESERLTQQLAEANANGLRFVSKPGRTNSGTPAQSIAELIRLLESNGMVCVSCKSNVATKVVPADSNKNGNFARTESNEHSTTNTTTRREVTIQIEGSFVQLQKSLQEVASIPGLFEIASITMGEANAQSSLRLWKLRVMV
ncbi:MAG: hypothetical protein U0930_15525 [Pirellulales bacterium]